MDHAESERPSKKHKALAQDAPQAVVLDIEGTVAPISFVHEVLFPYAQKKLRSYLTTHWHTPEFQAELKQLQAEVRVLCRL